MDRKIKSIAVFCGSRNGVNPVYQEAAISLGSYMAENGISLVYGGSKTGLMGLLATSVLNRGGIAIGIMPDFMIGHERVQPNLSELIIVDSLQERKAKMESLSSGSITMPGGFGTMDELFELLTWSQLGLHSKPIGIWNVDNYYGQLIHHLDRMLDDKFLDRSSRELLIISESMEELLEQMETHYLP